MDISLLFNIGIRIITHSLLAYLISYLVYIVLFLCLGVELSVVLSCDCGLVFSLVLYLLEDLHSLVMLVLKLLPHLFY